MAKNKIAEKMRNILTGMLFDLLTDLPDSVIESTNNPDERVKKLIQTACIKSAAVSTTLSIPAGITGVFSSIPDIVAVWKIQAQLVADIAAVHGKLALLSKESMMLCLFRHSMKNLVKDVAFQTGTRLLVHKLTTEAFQKVVTKVCLQFSTGFIRRMALKVIPAIGAAANGAVTYWDTKQVGKTAQAYFEALSEKPSVQEAEIVKEPKAK